jgi:hypothetical protein
MNRTYAVSMAALFALVSASALADDKSAPQPVDQAKLKAERDAAKAAQANMTPEEKAAAKKAKRGKKQQELNVAEKVGQPNAPAKSEALQKSVEATKNDPKALTTKEEKQKALKDQEKKSSGQ